MDNVSEVSESAPVDAPVATPAVAAAPASKPAAAPAATPSKKSVKLAKQAQTAERNDSLVAVGYRAGAKLAPPSHHCILIGANAGRNIINGVGVVIISDTNFGTETMQGAFIVEQIHIPDWRVDTMITIFKQLNAAMEKFEDPTIFKPARIRELREYLAWQIEALSLRLTGLVTAEQTKADVAYITEMNKLMFK